MARVYRPSVRAGVTRRDSVDAAARFVPSSPDQAIMTPWVLLHHETPDGSWHYDWMMQSGGNPGGELVTFRTRQRPDDPSCTHFFAERLADHRAVYLQFEGEISGDRGRVRRLAQGTCEIVHDAGEFVVELDGVGRWVGRRGGHDGTTYQFQRAQEWR
ncbi:MAG: hypothetical protein K2W85_05600 [Phycisphaerales bacterium]|nr:hypothetical protein [Phycisphaerales bacterium]